MNVFIRDSLAQACWPARGCTGAVLARCSSSAPPARGGTAWPLSHRRAPACNFSSLSAGQVRCVTYCDCNILSQHFPLRSDACLEQTLIDVNQLLSSGLSLSRLAAGSAHCAGARGPVGGARLRQRPRRAAPAHQHVRRSQTLPCGLPSWQPSTKRRRLQRAQRPSSSDLDIVLCCVTAAGTSVSAATRRHWPHRTRRAPRPSACTPWRPTITTRRWTARRTTSRSVALFN